MKGCHDLADLKAAQFIMGPALYCDFIWQERAKISAPVPHSKMRVLWRWKYPNVVPMKRKGA